MKLPMASTITYTDSTSRVFSPAVKSPSRTVRTICRMASTSASAFSSSYATTTSWHRAFNCVRYAGSMQRAAPKESVARRNRRVMAATRSVSSRESKR